MGVEDYYENGKRSWIRLHEKGGKRHEVPCHPSLEGYFIGLESKAEIDPTNRAGSQHRDHRLIAHLELPDFIIS